MNVPLVSIVMNCYNSEVFLKKAIESIYSQSYKNWEIIFWDNQSTDSSQSIAQSFDKKIKYYYSKVHTNLGRARKLALEKANGDYIAFLDCDDEWLPKKLEQQVYQLENNREFGFCYTGVYYINEMGKNIVTYFPKAKTGNVFPQQLLNYEIGIQSVLIRSGVPLTFKEELEYCPDYDLLINISARYMGIVINKPLIKYRIVSGSLTTKKISLWWSEGKIILDNLFSMKPELKEKYPRHYKNAYAKIFYLKARYFFNNNDKRSAINALEYYRFINIKFFLVYCLSLCGKSIWDFTINKINILEKGSSSNQSNNFEK